MHSLNPRLVPAYSAPDKSHLLHTFEAHNLSILGLYPRTPAIGYSLLQCCTYKLGASSGCGMHCSVIYHAGGSARPSGHQVNHYNWLAW
ncbi:hypothetical protein RSAG8_05305, partial [Rhizoctonia solani AG-8 WAC10335]